MAELSIVLPVYNVDPYLNVCLESIAAQTFQDFECILVDDGSTDFSGIICDSYSRKDDRFRVIHQENQGVSAARNVGIDAATAPLLAFIDPDDFISENYFSCLVDDLLASNAECSVSTFQYVFESGKEGAYELLNKLETRGRRSRNRIMRTNKEVINALCDNLFSCVSWGKVFTRELWGNARFPVGIDLGEDMMTVPPVIVKAKSAVCCPDARYFYRQRKRSLLNGTVTRERFEEDLEASRIMVDRLTECAPDRRRDFEMLKLQYDVGCYNSFLRSGGRLNGRGLLFHLYELNQLPGRR